ncbi:3-phosphoshikimate 1-carboxyvinyltransferase [Treponema sp.]|uniref:3-phosphoshikimate 1-carboxyvinyltransferase n=1 Tax=Treponema sp. TaxID=166 RepID=UPI003F111E3D
MKIIAKNTILHGHIQVPGSKSHTIRALLLASLAEGTSFIRNPLPSADCLSTSRAVPLIGAKITLDENSRKTGQTWTVEGAGGKIHLPDNVVDVGNSGSLLYFMSPIAATFDGWSIFTGDESIRKRPVDHVTDALRQLGAQAFTAKEKSGTCPLLIKGPVKSGCTVKTGGELSQYISGMMMAATRMNGTLKIELSNPKETPYLFMTKKWLESCGVNARISDDYKHIEVDGPVKIRSFDTVIPSDWEAVAFPLIAALITDSEITVDNVDLGGTQGDSAIVDVLKSLGADIDLNTENSSLTVRGGKKAKDGIGRLSAEHLDNGELHVNLSGFPDAVCALAAVSCFVEGTVFIEDISVCRKKETDRIAVLKSELEKLGASVEEGSDFIAIHGHSPVLRDGSANPDFSLHGAEVNSYLDHRVAMSLACLGLGLGAGQEVKVADAECCSVSFPEFFEAMNKIGAGFTKAT